MSKATKPQAPPATPTSKGSFTAHVPSVKGKIPTMQNPPPPPAPKKGK